MRTAAATMKVVVARFRAQANQAHISPKIVHSE